MHKKYAKDGLAVVSLNLEGAANQKRRQEVVDFLEAQKATFANLVLADGEEPDAWGDRLKINGPPYVAVYDRTGKKVKEFKDGVGADEHAEMDKLVAELLKQK